jgi:hypothetical protein
MEAFLAERRKHLGQRSSVNLRAMVGSEGARV